MASFRELIHSLKDEGLRAPVDERTDAEVTGIALDSRQVLRGDLFVALTGGSTDGHRYIPDAIRGGAAAVVGEQALDGLPVPYLQVTNSRRALAYLSAAFYGFPARRLTMIGVTGTDGKTTTSNLIYSILKAAGLKPGMITTVNALIGDQTLDTGFHVTTPEAPDVQRYLSEMAAAGLSHAILETTSHGLDQHRVTACDFDMALVTNITHEHLDYHGSYAAYLDAKARLFRSLADTPEKPFRQVRGAVLNREDASYIPLYKVMQTMPEIPTIRYALSRGESQEVDISAAEVIYRENGLNFIAHRKETGQSLEIESELVGEFNVMNCLAAISLTWGLMGLEGSAVQEGVRSLAAVPGRMERIDLGQEFTAMVDFAHTPNALLRALETARRLSAGRVIAVFGSAGLRDRQKRRMMAETSASLADLTVLTAEDPRTESLEGILAEMAAGAEKQGGVEGKTFWRIADRGEAIRFAVDLAQRGDLVIVCGKGHEQSMCFGETEYPWDDRIALRAALAARLGLPGPEMPYLPTQE